MKRKLKHINEFITQDLFEMANLRSKSTGLPMSIYVSEKNSQHGPRIKVSGKYTDKIDSHIFFSVSIADTPEIVAGTCGEITTSDLTKVFNWVKSNKDALLKYWEREIDTAELIDMLIRLS